MIVTQVQSSLPWLVFAIPGAAGVLILLLGRFSGYIRAILALAGSAGALAVSVAMALCVIKGGPHAHESLALTAWGNELRVDALSAFLTLVITGVGTVATVYSIKYMKLQALLGHIGLEITDRRLAVFYCLFMLFISTMLWGCVTNNIIMLFVAVEATTLASGFLVAFYWDKRGLEAGFKYLMLLTVGFTFALFGCVLVFSGAASKGLPFPDAFLLSEIRNVAPQFDLTIALMALAFLIVGFGTKAGIAPFHPWLPDAHAEAPTPVSALLSGVMLKMAAYALARTVTMFYSSLHPVTVFLMALGAFTMVLGILMALAQDDLKRLLAYSSVSQIGYVVMGIGIGTYLGVYGGLFHLLNHAICKALLFMCVGAVIYATGIRNISELGGISRKMPVTSACFFIGVLGISGMPPMNGFMSKLTIFLATASAHQWWATIIAMLTGILTLVALTRAAYRVFWGEPRSENAAELKVREVPASIWIGMAVLAGFVIFLGIYPQSIYPLLDGATKSLVAR